MSDDIAKLVRVARFRQPVGSVQAHKGTFLERDEPTGYGMYRVEGRKGGKDAWEIVLVGDSEIRYLELYELRSSDAEEKANGVEASGTGVEAAPAGEGTEETTEGTEGSTPAASGPVPSTAEVRKRPGKNRSSSSRKKSR